SDLLAAESLQSLQSYGRQPCCREHDFLERHVLAELLEILGPSQYGIPVNPTPVRHPVIIGETNDLALERGVAQQLADRDLATAARADDEHRASGAATLQRLVHQAK